MTQSMEHTWLRCIECDHDTDLLSERQFKCPKCQGLYEVHHDFSPITGFSDELKLLFQQRSMQPCFVNGNTPSPLVESGVWRFKELIMPDIADRNIVTLGEGRVPILKVNGPLQDYLGDVETYIILEGQTLDGSFKGFGGTVMISVAKAAEVQGVACSSTGDTSAMAAILSARAGLKCVVILPKGKITGVQLMQPLLHGATVILIPGTFDDGMKVMLELVEKYQLYPANSVNPTRIEGHQATVFLLAQYSAGLYPTTSWCRSGMAQTPARLTRASAPSSRSDLSTNPPKSWGAKQRLRHLWHCRGSRLKSTARPPSTIGGRCIGRFRLAKPKPAPSASATPSAARKSCVVWSRADSWKSRARRISWKRASPLAVADYQYAHRRAQHSLDCATQCTAARSPRGRA